MEIKLYTLPRFCLVGYGNIGKRHEKVISELGILTFICDPALTKSEIEQLNKKEITCLKTIKSLTNKIHLFDIIVICSPNGLHANQTIAGLKMGKHVICEKPIALSPKQCLSIVKTASQSLGNIIVVKQNRYHKPIVTLKELIDKNALGKIFSIQVNCFWNRGEGYYQNTWRGTQKMDGGILFTQFSHFFDLLLWLFGPVAETQSMGMNYNHPYFELPEDTVIINLRFKSGQLCSFHASINAYEKNLEGSILIIAENGTVRVNGPYLNTLECLQVSSQVKAFIKSEQLNGIEKNNSGNLMALYRHFLMNITQKKALQKDFEEAIATVSLISMIHKQIRTGSKFQ